MTHALTRAKIEWFAEHGYPLRGVVHVGANDGEEIAWYLHRNYRPVVAFEPLPAAFTALRHAYGDPHGVICVNAALGERDGSLVLHIDQRGLGGATSAYKPIPHPNHPWTSEDIWGDNVEVPLRRFDSWVADTCIDMSPFDVLVVDVQGMELEVLHGMGACLDRFKFLNIECSREPVYDGEAPAQMVVDFLSDQGFDAVTPVEDHDDILFVRVRESVTGNISSEPPTQPTGRPEIDESGADEPTADAANGQAAPPPLREWARENGWPELRDGRRRIPDEAKREYEAAFPGGGS